MRASSPQLPRVRVPGTAPVVDAIITCHNYGRFLGEAIDSVLAQSYPDIEIVVVDDGSTDDTAEVAARYADRGVRYVRRSHGGAGPARNTGLRATSAPLIAFLDADDAWLTHRVAAEVAHLERHPEVALVAAHAFACDEAMRPSSVVHALRGPASGMVLDALLVHNVVLNPSSVLVRRSALEAVGGFSEIPLGQDWDTWIEIAKHFPIGFIDEVVALVRRHSRSITPRSGRSRIDNNLAIVDRHLRDVQPAWNRAVLRRRAASAAYLHAGLGSAIQGDKRVARRYAVSAIALDPFTLARRKLALFARVFLSEWLVARLSRALKDDARLAHELVGWTLVRPDDA
jgi:glycosyltransferase involved in cell wall biosynthesis